MSSKKKTTQTTQTNNTVTPTNPGFSTDLVSGLAGQVTGLSGADPYSFTAGPDPLQTQAGQGAASLAPSANYGQASGILNNVASAGPNLSGGPASLLDNLQAYMSPYTDNVVNTTLRGFDENSGRVRAQQQLGLAADPTFGGSGGAITKALTERGLSDDRSRTEATLRDQAFNTGANLSNLDAGRRQQSSQFDATQRDSDMQRQLAAALGLSDVGSAQGADNRANIATQASIGDMLRQIQATHNLAPLSLLSTQTGLAGSLPLGLFRGENQTGNSTSKTTTSDPMGQIGSLALGLGALAGAPFTGGASLAALGAARGG